MCIRDSIDFDGRADTLRFQGNSMVRRLRAGEVADEVTGGTILWNNLSEVFTVEGGAKTATNPTGRVRAVLSPRADPSETPPARSPAADTLTPSRTLGDKP